MCDNLKYLRWLVHHQSRMVCQPRYPIELSDRVCRILRFLLVCVHRFLVLSLSCSPGTTEHETTISRYYVTREVGIAQRRILIAPKWIKCQRIFCFFVFYLFNVLVKLLVIRIWNLSPMRFVIEIEMLKLNRMKEA